MKGQKYLNFSKLITIYNKGVKLFNILFYYLINTLYIMISNFNNALYMIMCYYFQQTFANVIIFRYIKIRT